MCIRDSIDATHAGIDLPFERPLHQPPVQTALTRVALTDGTDDDSDVDAGVLFSQVTVDKVALAAHVHKSLQTRTQVSLAELLQARPLQQGLGELVAYLQLAAESPHCVVDESTLDTVTWEVPADEAAVDAPAQAVPLMRRAELPRVIFVRQ